MFIRRIVYRLGFRPELGNIFYSPSLSILYAFRDYPITIDYKFDAWKTDPIIETPTIKDSVMEETPETIIEAMLFGFNATGVTDDPATRVLYLTDLRNEVAEQRYERNEEEAALRDDKLIILLSQMLIELRTEMLNS